MLYTYATDQQTVVVNGLIDLPSVGFNTNCSISHSQNTNTISLNKAGFYKVTFSGTVANTTSTGGYAVIEARTNGKLYEGGKKTTFTSGTSDLRNVSFTIGVHIRPNCCQVTNNVPTILTFVNTGIEANYTEVDVVVEKIN